MKPKYYHKIPLDIFSGKLMLILVLFVVSSLSFVLGYYVGKNSGKTEGIVSDQIYSIKESEEKVLSTEQAPKGLKQDLPAIDKQGTIKEPVKDAGERPVGQNRETAEKTLKEAEKMETAKKTMPDIKTEKEIYYSIQVGAFKSKAQAERVRDRLSKKGYNVTIAESMNLYKVRVGRFETQSKARRFLKQLKERERLDGIVVRSRR